MTSKPPVKRPRRVTKALRTEICDRIFEGEFIQHICADPHMPDLQTVYAALRADEAFRREYEWSKQSQLDVISDEMMSIAGSVTSATVEDANARIEELKRLYDEDAETYGAASAPGGPHDH
jgi:hypothetical protein